MPFPSLFFGLRSDVKNLAKTNSATYLKLKLTTSQKKQALRCNHQSGKKSLCWPFCQLLYRQAHLFYQANFPFQSLLVVGPISNPVIQSKALILSSGVWSQHQLYQSWVRYISIYQSVSSQFPSSTSQALPTFQRPILPGVRKKNVDQPTTKR